MFAALTALASAGLLMAAALTPAPVIALPFVIAVCVGMPMFAALGLPPAVARLRDSRAVRALRRELATLPETSHPLGR